MKLIMKMKKTMLALSLLGFVWSLIANQASAQILNLETDVNELVLEEGEFEVPSHDGDYLRDYLAVRFEREGSDHQWSMIELERIKNEIRKKNSGWEIRVRENSEWGRDGDDESNLMQTVIKHYDKQSGESNFASLLENESLFYVRNFSIHLSQEDVLKLAKDFFMHDSIGTETEIYYQILVKGIAGSYTKHCIATIRRTEEGFKVVKIEHTGDIVIRWGGFSIELYKVSALILEAHFKLRGL